MITIAVQATISPTGTGRMAAGSDGDRADRDAQHHRDDREHHRGADCALAWRGRRRGPLREPHVHPRVDLLADLVEE
jgi:hypothetical protein